MTTATTTPETTRQDEIRTIQRDFRWLYPLLLGGFGVAIGIWIGSLLFASDTTSYGMNLYTEVISIGVTVVVIDRINRARDKRELRDQLLVQIHSPSNDWSLAALDRMRHEGWLTGENGILHRKHLRKVSWQNANLADANLRCTNLIIQV